jgi:hypothetical protein
MVYGPKNLEEGSGIALVPHQRRFVLSFAEVLSIIRLHFYRKEAFCHRQTLHGVIIEAPATFARSKLRVRLPNMLRDQFSLKWVKPK